MEPLEDDKIPVLKISYDQLCGRLEKSRGNHSNKEDGVNTPGLLQQKKHEIPSPRKNVHAINSTGRPSIEPTGVLKQSLERTRKDVRANEAWQEAWSKWSRRKDGLDKLLTQLSASKPVSCKRLDEAIEQCMRLEEVALELFSEQMDLAFKHDMVAKMWRMAHYPLTDIMRKLHKRATVDGKNEKSDLSGIMKSFFDHTMTVYLNLIEELQEKCGFDLGRISRDNGISMAPSPSKSHHRKVKQALNVCHQSYIFIGDMARYSEEMSVSPLWSRPRKYYLKSVNLVPKNGHPYNQLAVIAINCHRRLDAVYYYIRSLCSKNVFLSANDALTSLFDETAKKAQIEEKTISKSKKKGKKTKPVKATKRKNSSSVSDSREVWIMPGDDKPSGIMGETEDRNDQPLLVQEQNDTDLAELSKKLVNAFLIVHGKLFSRIGVESFEDSRVRLLGLLQTHLLQGNSLSPSRDGERFVMMVTINMFAVHQKLLEMKDSGNSFYVILSLSFGMDFITQLIHHVSHADHMTTIDQSHPLIVLLPSIRVWLIWVSTHLSDWVDLTSQPSLLPSLRGFLCGLAVLVNRQDEMVSVLMSSFNNAAATEDILPDSNKFWEDKLLAGFAPLPLDGDYMSYPHLWSLSDEQHYQQCLPRVRNITDTVTCLALNDTLPLVWEPDTGKFSVTVATVDHTPSMFDPVHVEDSVDESSDMDDNVHSICDEHDVEDVSTELRMLKLEKEELSKQMESQLQVEHVSKSLLDQAVAMKDSVVTVRPRYLVPDTNCFIDCLDSLQCLLDSGHFVIVVPLTVKTELDGLCKGNRSEAERDITVATRSAVEYIQLKVGSPHLKVLTSHGNLLSSLNITTELTDKATNDDLILTSSLKLHERVDSQSDNCSVVLLTDDRNLRVKSHASHMPVKNIPKFMDLFYSRQ